MRRCSVGASLSAPATSGRPVSSSALRPRGSHAAQTGNHRRRPTRTVEAMRWQRSFDAAIDPQPPSDWLQSGQSHVAATVGESNVHCQGENGPQAQRGPRIRSAHRLVVRPSSAPCARDRGVVAIAANLPNSRVLLVSESGKPISGTSRSGCCPQSTFHPFAPISNARHRVVELRILVRPR